MFIIGYFLAGLAKILFFALNIYMWVIIAQAILSWVNPDPFNPIVRFINQVTEPVLYQIRRRIPTIFGGIDFSPIIVLMVIIFLQEFLVNSLFHLARMLQ